MKRRAIRCDVCHIKITTVGKQRCLSCGSLPCASCGVYFNNPNELLGCVKCSLKFCQNCSMNDTQVFEKFGRLCYYELDKPCPPNDRDATCCQLISFPCQNPDCYYGICSHSEGLQLCHIHETSKCYLCNITYKEYITATIYLPNKKYTSLTACIPCEKSILLATTFFLKTLKIPKVIVNYIMLWVFKLAQSQRYFFIDY